MCDFLKANPWCSRNEYLWDMTIPQIKIASLDYSHTEYIASKEEKEKKEREKTIIGLIPTI